MVKLIRVEKSKNPKFKYTAFFQLDNGKTKKTNFGASGASDYTIHKDKDRRTRYRARHKRDLRTNDPMRAGYLSYYLLWGDSTSLKENIMNYKKKFNL